MFLKFKTNNIEQSKYGGFQRFVGIARFALPLPKNTVAK